MDLGNRITGLESRIHYIDEDLANVEARVFNLHLGQELDQQDQYERDLTLDKWLIFLGTLSVLSTTLATTALAILYSKGLI